MGKNIVAVIVGFLAMCVVVLGAHLAMLSGMGADRLFQPGNWDMSKLFIAVGIGSGVAGALLGGLVCAKIGRSVKPVRVLAAMTFGLGLANAVMMMRTPEPGPRPANVTMAEIVEKGKEPVWYSMATAMVGGLGVMVGGGLGRQKA